MLTEPQKASVRRHMGVPALGIANSFFAYDYFFARESGLLEYRMNGLTATEQGLVTGAAIGVYTVQGAPQAGDTITMDLPSGPITYTVVSSDVTTTNPNGPLMSIAVNAAGAITSALANTPQSYSATPQLPLNFGAAQPYVPASFAQIIVSGPSNAPFTLYATSTGHTALGVAQQGLACPVAATIGPISNQSTYYGYIAICDALESAIATANLSLIYQKADVVNFRPDEILQRDSLYAYYRQRLADVFGVPLYPMGRPGTGSGWAV